MKSPRPVLALTVLCHTALVPHTWAEEWPFQCNVQFQAQAQFTETTANYALFGACGLIQAASLTWEFSATATYTSGKPIGKAEEHYNFNKREALGEMWLSMDCFGDPWIEGGLCSRDSLRITWTGKIGTLLGKYWSLAGPIPPPFSASYLRRDPQHLQAYKSQRQAYLAKVHQDRQSKLTAQAKPVPGVIEETVNAPYMPTILSPAEGAQFVRGAPILLMVKPPEKDILGNTVQVEFQSCVFDPARNTCNWTPRGADGRVNVPDLLAGTYRLPARIVGETASWRLRVQRPADSITKTPAGYPSVWRKFVIVPPAAQQGPMGGPKLGQ